MSPSEVADAIPLPLTQEQVNRRAGKKLPPVQGIASTNFDDLVLRNGEGFRVAVGGSLLEGTMTRTMDGGSSISATFHDPKLKLQNQTLLSAQFDVKIDGVWFRYAGANKAGKVATISFIERPVGLLKAFEGPVKKVPRKVKAGGQGVTRAEFIAALVAEARPQIPTYIPELHVIQPVAKGKEPTPDAPATSDANAVSVPGFSGANLTVKGIKATASQIALGTKAMTIADGVSAPRLAVMALLEALIVESVMGDIAPDNVLQGTGPTGAPIGSAEDEISGFLTGKPTWTGVEAIAEANKNPNAAPHEIAQLVQRSGAGLSSNGAANYGPWEDEAAKWIDAWGGSSGVSGDEVTTTTTEPYAFEVKKNENYWDAIKRLAGEVRYRAFVSGGRFFYVAEPKLFAQQVRLGIAQQDGDILTRGVDDVDYDYNSFKAITEVTVTARAKEWACPPGTVVTLQGFGPASIGDYFSNPKLQTIGKDEKGKPIRAGLDRARPVVGRYIVSSIDSSFSTDTVSIKLRKPTEALPEPAAQTTTTTTAVPQTAATSPSSTAFVGNMGDTSGTAKQVVDRVVNFANEKLGFDCTPESVEAANATHGPTVSGGRSDHQGPPATAWAADISNGISTPEEAHLAAAIAQAFGFDWSGAGLVDLSKDGWAMQLIHNTDEGGDHYDHVHFGLHRG